LVESEEKLLWKWMENWFYLKFSWKLTSQLPVKSWICLSVAESWFKLIMYQLRVDLQLFTVFMVKDYLVEREEHLLWKCMEKWFYFKSWRVLNSLWMIQFMMLTLNNAHLRTEYNQQCSISASTFTVDMLAYCDTL